MRLSPHGTWLALPNLEGLVGENMGLIDDRYSILVGNLKKVAINTWMILDIWGGKVDRFHLQIL